MKDSSMTIPEAKLRARKENSTVYLVEPSDSHLFCYNIYAVLPDGNVRKIKSVPTEVSAYNFIKKLEENGR